MRFRHVGKAEGFTYIGVLFAVVLAGVALTLTAQVWSTNNRRAKEAQLLFAGGQLVQAIGRYYEQSPGQQKQYPKNLEDLLLDRRYPEVRRYLRRIYFDPMTGRPEWGLLLQPDGGITGVYSLSSEKPFRTVATEVNGVSVGGGREYSQWHFIYDPNAAAAVAARRAGAAGAPGQAGKGTGADAEKGQPRCVMVVLENNVLFCKPI
jgi:hypothetical protein